VTTQLRAEALETLAVAILPLMEDARAGTIAFTREPGGDWAVTVVPATEE